MSAKENINFSEDDSIDLIALVKTAWAGRKLILKVVCISFVIGCIVALTSPVIYVSQTIFVPQVSDKGISSPEGLGSLASLAGIDINQSSSTTNSYVSPMLYSKIVESEEFSLTLINEELISLNGDSFSIKDYMISDQNSYNVIGFIKKYTIGLFTVSNTKEAATSQILEDYNFINKDDYGLIKRFKKKFSIEANKKEGYIKVTGNDKDAFMSTQIVKLVTKNLQSRIISLKINKVKEQLDYSKEQYEQQKNEFETLQDNISEFKDSNKNISTALFLSELQKLESEYELQENILMRLASEYNNNKIELSKDTPIFSVLDEVSVPNERSKPKRSQIVLIYMFVGVIISIGYILYKDTLNKILQNIKENS